MGGGAGGAVWGTGCAVPAGGRGWTGVGPGGFVARHLDGAGGGAAWHRGHAGVTVRLEVRWRLPLRIGERIRLTGRVGKVRRTLVYATSSIERLAHGATSPDASATPMGASPPAAPLAPPPHPSAAKAGAPRGVTGFVRFLDVGTPLRFAFVANGEFSGAKAAIELRDLFASIAAKFPDAPPADQLVPAPSQGR